VELDVHCRACGHRWRDEISRGTLLSTELPVMLRAKIDRRQNSR
jgi:hypothetical protein